MISNIFLLSLGLETFSKYLILIIGIALTNPIAQLLAAASGLYNLIIILVLSVLIELTLDTFYFCVGRFSKKKILNKKHIFGIKKESINKLGDKLDNNFFKTLAILKVLGPIAGPFTLAGLLALGLSKIKMRVFMFKSLLINIPKNLIIILIGYYLGFAVNSLVKYLKIGQYFFLILAIVAVLIVIIYMILKKISKKKLNKF